MRCFSLLKQIKLSLQFLGNLWFYQFFVVHLCIAEWREIRKKHICIQSHHQNSLSNVFDSIWWTLFACWTKKKCRISAELFIFSAHCVSHFSLEISPGNSTIALNNLTSFKFHGITAVGFQSCQIRSVTFTLLVPYPCIYM